MELRDHRQTPVPSPSEEPESARGLAVHEVEGNLGMEVREVLRRCPQPRRITHREACAFRALADEVPARPISLGALQPFGMPGGDDLYAVSVGNEPAYEVIRVVLHSAGPVDGSGDGDDAYLHVTSVVAQPSKVR